MTAKKKVKESTECKDGTHKFTVTSWRIHGGIRRAVQMRCQHCLVPVDMEELESLEFSREQGINQ